MSIAPVSTFPPESNESTANSSSNRSPTSSASGGTEKTSTPVSESLPKEETSAAKSAPVAYELPEDVVEVHQDPDIKSQVIIQYLDEAKDVVLQVPSNQELGVEHGIAQDFQNAAKTRKDAATTGAVSEGEKPHGD
jgi:hypothetical protein